MSRLSPSLRSGAPDVRYHVTIGGRKLLVEVTPEGVVVDGEHVDAELASVPGTAQRHLLLGGRSYPLSGERGEARGSWAVRHAGRSHAVEVVDERTQAIRELAGATSGPTGPRPVKAPMPGLVLRIEVEAGQEVRAGQGIVIVEAMKMENELKAEGAGVVSRIHAVPGQAVEKGTVLVEFEPVPAAGGA